MLRRLLLVLVALVVVLLVIADRVGAVVAAHVLADKVQTDEHLSHRPDASVGGFPFLTQAIHGNYSDVSITAHHLVTNGVPVNRLTAHLHGVHVPLSKVLSGSVNRVPVDRTDGEVFLSYSDLNAYLRNKHLTVSQGSGGTVHVMGSAVVAGQQLSVSGNATASVRGNVITVTTRSVSAGAAGAVATIPVHLSVSLPLLGLPFRISLASVHATGSGVVATGTVHHLVLGGGR